MAKTLILHCPSYTGPDEHITAAGRTLAAITAVFRYRDKKVDHMFWSPLTSTIETAIAMMVNNKSFDGAMLHDPVVGLGTPEALNLIGTEKFRDLIAGGLTKLEALLISTESNIIKAIAEETEEGLQRMFTQMSDGELGVGVFPDPFTFLAAKRLGLKNTRVLFWMEAIVFVQDDDGNITASWPDIN
jgi:hypothetical protein